MRLQSFESCSFAPFVAIHQLAEVGLSFNVVLIFAVCKLFLHNGENSLNYSAARSALVGSELTSETVQEVAHRGCKHSAANLLDIPDDTVTQSVHRGWQVLDNGVFESLLNLLTQYSSCPQPFILLNGAHLPSEAVCER